MEKKVIAAIFEAAVESGGDYYEIDLITHEFYRLLDAAYAIKNKSLLSGISEKALKLIDEEIKNEKQNG